MGTNKLDTCRMEVNKKEDIKMAKENDDIRDIMDKQKNDSNINEASNKSKWLIFSLIALFVVIYILFG